jgi:hypothetical protein
MVEARLADGTNVELHDDGTWTRLAAVHSNPASGGFRRAAWGGTRAEVQASEGRSPDGESDGNLRFAVTIAGLEATALYIFVSDTLVRAKYLITQPHSDYSLYLQDFSTLDALLTAKYGKAQTQDQFWNNDLYEDSPQEYGMAIAAGHMSRFYRWKANDTSVCLAIHGDNYDISLQIEYAGLEFEKLESEHTQSAALDDL